MPVVAEDLDLDSDETPFRLRDAGSVRFFELGLLGFRGFRD